MKKFSKQKRLGYLPLVGRFGGAFFSHEKNMGLMLAGNQILLSYTKSGHTPINNFLRGRATSEYDYTDSYNPDNIDTQPSFRKSIFLSRQKDELKSIRRGKVVTDRVCYPPITKAFVKAIIEIDTAFRLSKRLNKNPKTLYRGTVEFDEIDMKMINSWSIDCEIAADFATPTVLKTRVPAGFPSISINDTNTSEYKNENEFILPPCEFVASSEPRKSGYTGLNDGHYDKAVVLRPLNLAKVLLERMKNPPPDYPKTYLLSPKYEYAEAMAILEKYIRKYVDKGRIKFGIKTIDEKPDPSIDFGGEKEER